MLTGDNGMRESVNRTEKQKNDNVLPECINPFSTSVPLLYPLKETELCQGDISVLIELVESLQ